MNNTNPAISSGIQDITYTYDAVGNITNIADTSNTEARHTALYTYDTLYRLTSAMTSVASSSPYLQTYSYDALGNITSRSDVGSYMYQGTTTGSYANSHAPTNIAGLAVAYDRNGNLTNYASTTNAWDYRNRMMYSYASSSPTSIFNTYDHSEQRMTKWVMNVGTTTYPSRWYTTQGATSTISKSIFAGDELIATIRGSGTATASTTKEFAHLDHLGSTNVTTSATGTIQSVISYFPYGGERVTTASSTTDRHYIGERADSERALSYLNNRYMSPGVGQFLSVDSIFLNQPDQFVVDPQQMNSYSYSRGNPIYLKDSSGKASLEAWSKRPVSTGLFVLGLGAIGLYLQETGRPASAQLLWHAASLNPQNLNVGNGSSHVQAITSSNLYQSNLQQLLWDATVAGKTSIVNTQIPLKFTDGDAGTSFGKIDLYVSAQMSTDGAWQISARGTDYYDFDLMNYRQPFLSVGNNFVYFSQIAGATSNYNVNVNFSHSASLGFSASQSSAISGVAQAFGVRSLTSNQVSAIQGVQSAFSKK